MLRRGRAILAAVAIAAASGGLSGVVPGVAYAKPNDVTVAVSGCVVRVSANDFDPSVDTVTWSIYRSGTSGVLRSGVITIGASGAGSSTVSPALGTGKYRLTWSYSWRGQSAREGEAFFTVSNCGSQSTSPTTSPTPSPTTSATASASPTVSSSSSPSAMALPSDVVTPEFGGGVNAGPTVRSTRTAGEGSLPTGTIAVLAALALASGGTAAYLASRRTPSDHRRHRGAKAGPNLRFSGSSAPER